MSFLLSIGPLGGQTSVNALAESYVAALQGVMVQSATAREIDQLLALYGPDVVYEHPRVRIRIDDRNAIRDGMMTFLGTTRSPVVEERDRIVGKGVVVLSLRVAFEARQDDGWVPVTRTQVTVLDIAGGLITRVIDYW